MKKIIVMILTVVLFALGVLSVNAAQVLYGDANTNSVINVQDVTFIQKYLVDMQTLNEKQLIAADVDGNGSVDINDATIIQSFLIRRIDKFPVEEKNDPSYWLPEIKV